MSRTIEERLAGGGGSIPWIPDPEKAAKYDNDSCQLNPLIGTAVDHFKRTNFRGDGDYNVIVLSVEGVGDVAVHCQATVLANEMLDKKPRFGEKVGVVWKGEVTPKGGGRAYNNFDVIVEREAGGEFRWTEDAPSFDEGPREPDSRRAPDPTPPPPSSPPQQAASQDDDIPF